ncbi:MAG: hypothetical protein A2Y75_01515 [Candidatus Solincola sediminis]|uniref:Uncharacterized protein n=1 Tax=Candidatus Solincola sediminis TaxID=1797199 RepID=A0A1F2WNK3_9ACTN|nr:MAG: hypothetical protein A2Y75_01515 [Candidatus Solincola sediminis]
MTSLVKKEPFDVTRPTTESGIEMALALKEESEKRLVVAQYINRHLHQGVDFGVIPGTKEQTLLKPGAEKLVDLFRCTPQFEILDKVEDWASGLFNYTFRVRIAHRESGKVLAEGYGSANSREGRYRWRNDHRKCPSCGKESIYKSKWAPRDQPYAKPGWYCNKKAGGCGETFADGDQRIESQTEGKVENDDIYTLVNTILKMAKKRALVDGAIALARCSDMFGQDLEDLEPLDEEPPSRPAKNDGPCSELQTVLARIANSVSEKELKGVAEQAAKLTDADKAEAKKAYLKKLDELKNEEPPHDPKTGEVTEASAANIPDDDMPMWDEPAPGSRTREPRE